MCHLPNLHLRCQHSFRSRNLERSQQRTSHSFGCTPHVLLGPSKSHWQVRIRRRHQIVFAEGSASGESGEPQAAGFVRSSNVTKLYRKDEVLEAFRVPPVVETVAAAEEWPESGGEKAAEFVPEVAELFFDRELELNYLRNYITGLPNKVILLLGPRNCGTTALLKEIRKEDKSRFLYLDCAMNYVITPTLMAQALQSKAKKLPKSLGKSVILIALKILSAVLQIAIGFFNFSKNKNLKKTFSEVSNLQVHGNFMDELFPEGIKSEFYCTLKSLGGLVESASKAGKNPVIVIDKINTLKLWKVTEEKEIKAFLGFLKAICNQEKLAHVIFATSDSSMVSWLNKYNFAGDVRTDLVLGELTREEALRYVRGDGSNVSVKRWPGLISQSERIPELRKEDWEKVWATCGGNMYLLGRSVDKAKIKQNWDEAVEEILQAPAEDVDTALFEPKTIAEPDGVSSALWTGADYKTALRLISAAAPYYAVSKKVLQAELEKDKRLADAGLTGAQVLLSMVEYEVLFIRSYSDMARDIPRAVFFREYKGNEVEGSVVMMPTPAHQCAALRLYKQGYLE